MTNKAITRAATNSHAAIMILTPLSVAIGQLIVDNGASQLFASAILRSEMSAQTG